MVFWVSRLHFLLVVLGDTDPVDIDPRGNHIQAREYMGMSRSHVEVIL